MDSLQAPRSRGTLRLSPPSPAPPAEASAGGEEPVDSLPEVQHHSRHLGAKIGAGLALGLVGLGAASGAALGGALPAPIGAPTQQWVASVAPQPVVQAFNNIFEPNPGADTPSHYGEVYEITPTGQGQSTLLAMAGQTTPDGNNIPANAVVNNRVVIGVEGIDGGMSSYTHTYTDLLDSNKSGSYNLNQPIVMVHEGTDATRAADITRIAEDYGTMKQVQAGVPVDQSQVFKTDPSVQSTYNLMKQSLDQGHQVLVVAHSGGGAVSALALNMLSHQPGYHDKIAQDVRVLSFAGVASQKDYNQAGVPMNNVLYVGDHRDAVAQLGSVYVTPSNPTGDYTEIANALTHSSDFTLGVPHSPYTIMPENVGHIQSFLAGGPGGTYIS